MPLIKAPSLIYRKNTTFNGLMYFLVGRLVILIDIVL